jgi:glutamine cyclotransferase
MDSYNLRFIQKTYQYLTLLILYFFFFIISNECAVKDSRKNETAADSLFVNQVVAGKSRIIKPEMNQRFIRGAVIEIVVEEVNERPGIDSVIFYTQSLIIGKSITAPYQCEWNSRGCKTGENKLRAVTYYSNKTSGSNFVSVTIVSDIEPVNLRYEIINTYPHDIQAYTQGLVYEDGYLYEGTGQYNESSLRKVVIQTGEPEMILNLPGDIFGEGITIFKDRIFQLTYKSQVGFVYEKESFARLQRVYYQNKEGWGLTSDGARLIMSDGSNNIYFMDPEYFTELDRIEVFDSKGPVNRLNELEYIEGRIFSNIYGTNEIVVIDPETGVVLGRMNLMGILSEKDRHSRIDVLNGIAYDPDTERIFVTGKYWPKLFEIRLFSEL